jgi:predicted nucleic acid-binding protein
LNFLLDTNVVSELGRTNADRNVVAWANRAGTPALHLSVLTLGEIAKGATRLERRDAVRGAALWRWLDGLRQQYADRIIGVDDEIAEAWGRLASGRSIPVVDALLTATASVRRMTLVTRNVRDIAEAGVPVLNPWNA